MGLMYASAAYGFCWWRCKMWWWFLLMVKAPYKAPSCQIIIFFLQVRVQLFTLGEWLEMGFRNVEKTMLAQRSSQRHNTKHIGGVDVVSIKVIMMIVIASIYESLQSWLQPSFNERRRSVREVCGRSGTLIQILFSCLFVFKGWDWFTTQQLRSRPEI